MDTGRGTWRVPWAGAPGLAAGAAALGEEPAPPRIANLACAVRAERLGGRYGFLEVEFDFELGDAEVELIAISLEGWGDALNLVSETAHRKRGRARVGQTVILGPRGAEQCFTVRLIDRRGQSSNRLSGSFVSP
jgi:hypothetical protein